VIFDHQEVGWRAGGVGQEKGSVAGSAELELALKSGMGLLLQVDVERRGFDRVWFELSVSGIL
jgi:hypothetical protein